MATMTADEIISFLETNEKVKIVLNPPKRETRTVYATLSINVIPHECPFDQKEIITKENGDKKTRVYLWDIQRKMWEAISVENLVTIETVTEVPELPPEEANTAPADANTAPPTT